MNLRKILFEVTFLQILLFSLDPYNLVMAHIVLALSHFNNSENKQYFDLLALSYLTYNRLRRFYLTAYIFSSKIRLSLFEVLQLT